MNIDKKQVLKDAIAAYSHANNLPMDISKKAWVDYMKGKNEDEKIRNYLMVQMGLCKRIIDTIIGEDSKLLDRPTMFLADISEIYKKLEKKVN